MRSAKVVRMKGAGGSGGKSIETVDTSTGEVLDGVFVDLPQRAKSPFGKDWLAVAQSALTFLAENRRTLGEEGFAVFCALASKLDWQNFILINQAEVARSLGMDRGNVNKSIRKLEAMGVLTRGPKSGVSPTFRLNPAVGWKGRQKEHFGALQQARAQGWRLIEGGQGELDLKV